MARRSAIDRLLRPESVAIIGASSDPAKTAGRPLHYLRLHGFTGEIWPINPRYDDIDGQRCYGSVTDLPGPPDAAIILVGPTHAEQYLRDLAAAGAGAAAILMAEILEISYTEVVVAAIVPALLYYVAVFVYADLEAAKKNILPVPENLIPPLLKTLKEGWFFMLPFAVLIYALFGMNRAPETAALWSGATVVIVNWVFGYKGTRITVLQIITAVRDTGLRGGSEIVIIGAMAGLIIGILGATGLGEALTQALVTIGEGNLALLLGITAIICIILGMGMPTTAIYLLVSIIAAPPLVKLGINPLAAHMYVFYFGIVSLITPPVAIAAFVAANLAGACPMATAVTAVRLGWTALVVPVMFVLSPNLIMQGETGDIIIAFVTAVAGVWVTTCGIQGYFIRPLGLIWRTGFMAAGIMLLIPSEFFSSAIYVEITGIALTVILVGRELLAKRRLSPA